MVSHSGIRFVASSSVGYTEEPFMCFENYVGGASESNTLAMVSHDQLLISKHTCPICTVRCGGARPRHALVQHMYRKKKSDVEHAVWIAANHKKYFPVGRAKPVQQQLSVADVENVISRHCGKQFLKHLKEGNVVGQGSR